MKRLTAETRFLMSAVITFGFSLQCAYTSLHGMTGSVQAGPREKRLQDLK